MNKARTYRQYVKKYKLFLRIYCTFHEKYNQEKKSLKRLLEGQLKKKKVGKIKVGNIRKSI